MATLQSSVRFFDEAASAMNRARNAAIKASAGVEEVKAALSSTSRAEAKLTAVTNTIQSQQSEVARLAAEVEDYKNFLESMPNFSDGSKMTEDATLTNLIQQLDKAKIKYAELDEQKAKHDQAVAKQAAPPPTTIPQQGVPPPQPPTVEEPYKWQSVSTPEIFQTTGAERLKQEVAAADAMAQKLMAVQAGITIRGQNTKLFPPEMGQDLENAYQRIKHIQEQMDAIANQKNVMKGKLGAQETEQLNASFERLRGLMDTTLNEQNQLNAAMKRGDISEVNKSYEKLVHNIDSAETHIRDNIKEQTGFNSEIDRGTAKAGGLSDKIGGFVKAFLGMAALKKGFDVTVGAAAELSGQINMMPGMFGNANIGQAYFGRLQDYALKTGKSMGELTGITQQFLSSTKNTDKLMGLTDIANKLAVKNSSQGIEGAGYAINEALSGQFTSLKNRFNLSSSQLEPIKEAVKKGNMDGIIQAFDTALDNAGITDDVVNAYQQTAPMQFQSIMNTIKSKLAQTGMDALAALQPLMTQFSTWLQSPQAAEFFDNIKLGVTAIAEKAAEFGGVIVQIGGFFSENWGVIEPIIWGIAAAMAVYETVTLAMAAAQWALNAAEMASPTTWIILAVVALIAIIVAVIIYLKKLWETNDDFALGVMKAWNGVLNFFDQVPIFFAKVWDGICGAFESGKSFAVGIMEGLANEVISGVNWIIEQLRKLSFIEIEAIGQVQWKAASDAKSFAAKQGRALDISTMEASAAQKAAAREQQAQDKINERKAARAQEAEEEDYTSQALDKLAAEEAAWNAKQTDNLGSIDKSASGIKDSVDKTEEDLKWMRDIADKEVTNRFTTAMLAPQIHIKVEGVNGEVDVDGIARVVAQKMSEEVDITAEGEF